MSAIDWIKVNKGKLAIIVSLMLNALLLVLLYQENMGSFLSISIVLIANITIVVYLYYKDKLDYYVLVLVFLGCICEYTVFDFAKQCNDVGMETLIIWEHVLKIGVCVICFFSVFIIKLTTLPLHKVFAVVGLLIGMSYMIIITPMAVPDEYHHYKSSYIISNYITFEEEKLKAPADYMDFSGFTAHYNSTSSYERFDDDFFIKDIQNDVEITAPYDLSYPIEHLPQAVGITFARILKLNFMGTFYLARLCGLIYFVLCVSVAIRVTTRYKSIFFIVSLLPMVMQQAASLSSDAFIIGMSLLLIAVLIRTIDNKGCITKREILEICILGFFLAPAKLVYFCILGLATLIPAKRFSCKKTQIFTVGGILTVGLLAIILFKLVSIVSVLNAYVPENNYAEIELYSIGYFLENPIGTIKLYVETIITYGVIYYRTMIGEFLCGLTLKINRWLAFTIESFVVLTGLITYKDEIIFNKRGKITCVIICLCVFGLVLTSMAIAWTPITSEIIEGVQGRYFVPILPLAIIVLKNRRIIVEKHIERLLIVTMAVLSCCVLYNVVGITF